LIPWHRPALTHLDHNRIAPQAQHESLTLRLQAHDDVLQPKAARTLVAEGKPLATLGVGSGRLRDIVELVYLSRHTDGGSADAADN
jgi:hypothetical protein